MATGFYTLGDVSVALGSTTASTFGPPGSASEAVNFANLVGISGAEGMPAGHLIIAAKPPAGVRASSSGVFMSLSDTGGADSSQ